MSHIDVQVALAAALGDAVSFDPLQLGATTSDRSGYDSHSLPIALVTARDTADVRATMRIATEFRVPVVPRGAGTGLAGGAIASSGQIVLSTIAMNRILEVSAADELAVVQPGIVNADLNAALAAHGLWFTPDPASRATSTVGGNIATNAGGLLCAKYGVTREAVLSLDVVLADGRLMTFGHRSVKGVTGLDLAALLIGSEGTLGIIVEATVKLRPLPTGTVATISAFFSDIVTAASSSAAITAAGIRPAAMELLDSAALDALAQYLSIGFEPGVCLIVQTDGAAAEAEAATALAIITDLGGTAELTTDPLEGERLFALRRSFHPAMERLGTVLIEDVAVPRSALPAMFAAIAEIGARYGIRIPTVAHAGDGNLHPNFVYQPGQEGEVPEVVWQAAGDLFEAALALGGTLSGEHGIGILKKRWLSAELGEEQVALQRGIKALFDPLSILNPGKVY